MMAIWAALLASGAQLPPVPIAEVGVTGPQLIAWTPASVQCANRPARWLHPPDPAPSFGYGTASAGRRVVSFTFTVASDGRVLDVTRTTTGYSPNAEDLAPALAAARFPAGAATACTIAFAASATPLADAPIEQVFALAAYTRGAPPSPVLARIRAAGGDCMRGQSPVPRERSYPDFKALPRVAGAPGWTVTRFDIDASGRPVRVATATGSGNAALDRAAADAIRRSRFEAGARLGCLWPSWVAGEGLVPPPAPEEAALRPDGATCPAKLPYVRPPTLTMPEPYRRRSIEGWAVVAYDVAPWGGTGNLRVLAAQPTAEFGDWALNVIRNATKPASNTGYVGCVDRVRFKLGDEAKLIVSGSEVEPATPAPPPF